MASQISEAAGATARIDPVGAIRSLTEGIRSECHEIDTTRRVPTPIVDALRDADVFRLLAPVDIGGHEVDPVTFLDVVEATSHADGSVGWCVLIGGCYATFGGLLPPDGARAVYGDPDTISAGAFRPNGVAIEVGGGYRISGRWPLASGSSHANWYVGGCVIQRNGEPVVSTTGAPLVREFFFPGSVVDIIDTWDSTGLRGTASHDYAVDDVYVPESHTMWFQEPPAIERPLYRMPPVAMFATFIGAVPLGIARHAIDEFVSLATTRTPELSPNVLADKPVVHDRLGRAHVLVAAGRRHLTETLDDLWTRVLEGHAPTMADRGALWLAAAHAAHTALEAIGMLYTAAGASSVYASSPLDRCLRDARTAVQHICTQEQHFELAGRHLLGREIIPSAWAIDDRGEA
ncbi:MAG: acyl-CoA dehydrogenase family protein [Acidimicrobiales bacterium]